MKRLIVAIDGPSGAGKGTVARAVASRLGYRHVDTGAMYRAVAWKAVHDALDLEDEAAIADMAARAEIDVSDGAIRIDGHDVRHAIRTPEIDSAAAAVAKHQRVRAVLIAQQRDLGATGGVVMEGRDIGTVVFPQADIKVYLDASPEERARRRANDASHAVGKSGAAIAEIASALAERDRTDTTRPISPLTRAGDAVRIDTTGIAVDDVVRMVLDLVEEKTR